MVKFNIEQFLNLQGYATDERKSRRKGSKGTQEFFTPYEIVKKMGDKISEEDWIDTTKTFCDPCFGNGQETFVNMGDHFKRFLNWKEVTSEE